MRMPNAPEWRAARAVGYGYNPSSGSGVTAGQAVPRLSQTLLDEHLDVRKAAVLSLTRWANSEVAARDALGVALKDVDADVRAYARRALARQSA
jgi:HEAT repeat protein